MRINRPIILFGAVLALPIALAAHSAATRSQHNKQDKRSQAKPPFEKVVKTEAEWKKILPADVFEITRKAGTEPAFHNEYWNNHAAGIYKCADCGLELFTSKTKFESGTGWPSFWQPIDSRYVTRHSDHELEYERTEVRCARCGAHLGHVFDDGPKPTGLRYCMNSAALKFVKETKDSGTKASPRK